MYGPCTYEQLYIMRTLPDKFSFNTTSTSLHSHALSHLIERINQPLNLYTQTNFNMQFTTTALLSTVVAIAAAAPAPQLLPVVNNPKFFSLIAIRSGSAVQYSPFNAAKSSLFAGLPNQGASCDKPGETTATFFLGSEGGLFLNTDTAGPQQIFVDRSGMGMSSFSNSIRFWS